MEDAPEHPFFEITPDIKPKIPFAAHHRRGMGTELVAPFLYSMIRMVRPRRVLEVGLGYSTPWLLRGIDDNVEGVHIDRNCDPSYFRTPYDPLVICIDDLSDAETGASDAIAAIRTHPRLRLMQLRFQGQAGSIQAEHGDLDFVWFDCGGPDEYEQFCSEYLPICSDYVFFHFTYSNGAPNENAEIISNHLAQVEQRGEEWFRTDIIEPHKHRQGSVTMLRRRTVR